MLSLAVADLLLRLFPREPEGELARRHAALVRAETLVEIATTIGQAKRGIEQIASAAQQADKAATEAAGAAAQQSKGAEELASAIEEISSLADELQSAA